MRPRRPLSFHWRVSRLKGAFPGRLLFALLTCLSLPAAAQELRLRIGDLTAPLFQLRGVEAALSLSPGQPLRVHAATLAVRGRVWRNVQLHCGQARIATDLIECRQGSIRLDALIPLSLSYRPLQRVLTVVLQPAAGERWELRHRMQGRYPVLDLRVEQGALARLNPFLPAQWPQFSAGTLTLNGHWTGGPRELLQARGSIVGAAFSDQAGLHAGENLGGDFDLRADFDQAWAWALRAAWTAGEVFWQPFYLAQARRTLTASGRLDGEALGVREGRLELEQIGRVDFSGSWDRQRRRLTDLAAEGHGLRLGGIYDGFLKPLWQGRLPGQLALEGGVSGRIEFREGALTTLDVEARDAGVRHEYGLLALQGVNARVPWRRGAAGAARIAVESGQLWGVPLGRFALNAELGPEGIYLDRVAVPLLDGMLNIEGVRVVHSGGEWRWEGGAALQPVSMERLSEALRWPQMHGSLSGVIPRLSYARETLAAEGALLFRLFDGTVVAKDLRVTQLLSRAPHAFASVDMRGLDLDLLTRTFAFGSMQGRVDVQVNGMELANWRPVRFDAKVESSPGDYPRRISQRAVEHIAALGGASAGAALQRSFLRFFEQFRYDRIGLRCRLERNTCAMSGIEDVNGGFLIVRGGGIPAISVIGYNRDVGWNELLGRLARIRQGGVKPVVQ